MIRTKQAVLTIATTFLAATTASAQMAEQISSAMQTIPMEELPQAMYLASEFDPELQKSLLTRMTPDNMLVTLVAKGVPVDRTERYYRARGFYERMAGGVAEVQDHPQARLALVLTHDLGLDPAR